MTRIRIIDTARPSRRLEPESSADVMPTDVPKLMQILQGRRAVRPDWRGRRLAIEAYDRRRGWLRYEQPL